MQMKKKDILVNKTPSPKREVRLTQSGNLTARKLDFSGPPTLSTGSQSEQQPQKHVPSHSTSYFSADNLIKAKTQAADDQRTREIMLSKRIHTFTCDMEIKPTSCDDIETISGIHLSKRNLSDEQLQSIFEDIKVLRLPKLYSKVRPPQFLEPQYSNWATVGIITNKTAIKLTSANSKYFRLTISDFKFNLDVAFFGKAAEKYYKLKTGDVIAILNPQVNVWRPDDDGKVKSFSLNIRHDYDCIVEIGTSKGYGHCKINKKDGTPCGNPINTLKEDRCYYHKEMQFRSTTAKRMELNGSFAPRSPTKNGVKQAYFMDNNRKGRMMADRTAPKTDRNSQNGVYFSNPNAAKAFFDDEYSNPDVLRDLDAKRRRIEEQRKEKKMLQQLNKKELLTTTKSAFDSKAFSQLGFDPTLGKYSQLKKDSTQKTTNAALQDLMSIKKSSVNLKPSAEALAEKKRKRQQALQRQQEYNMSSDDDLVIEG